MKGLWAILFVFLISSPSYSGEAKPVVAVYPSWKHNKNSIKSIPWARFSHLAVAGIYPKEDGSLHTVDADVFLDELIAASHANGKKVILSIGGAGEASAGFLEIGKSQEKRSIFVKKVAAYVEKHNIDGVDIDWEYWTYQSKLNRGGQDAVESNQLVLLVKSLRQHFPKPFLLTVDIAPGDWIGEQYSVELQDHADYVNLMAFDFTGAWKSSKVGYHSDRSTFKKSLEYVLKRGFNSEKVIVGLPAYGIEFINGKNSEIRHVDYNEIVEMLGRDSKKLAKSKMGDLYFEDRDSIAAKCEWINKNKMAGVFIFNILSDHQSEQYSLLASCNKVMPPKN